MPEAPTAPAREARKLLQHAVLLIARQHGGDAATADAARQELARWRQSAPAHEQAARRAQQAWAATEASGLQGAVPPPLAQAARRAQARRRVLSALGIAGLAVAVGGAVRWQRAQPLERIALRTGRGQLLARTLPDGSRLDLAPNTRADAVLYRDRRTVRLLEGEIRCEVQPDAARPFEVLTDWGRVRVLGTAFSVAVHGGRMAVAVAEGRVAVWRAGQGAHADAPPDAELVAGQAVRTGDGQLEALDSVRAGDVGAWRQGWLVFDRTPLPEVLARWNDYLAQPLVLADAPALQRLRLTGSFPVRDPGAFLASLPKVLPVRVEATGQGAHTVRMR